MAVTRGAGGCDDHCGRLGVVDLVPLLPWFLYERRCRHCGAAVSAAVPLLECGMVAVVLASAVLAPSVAQTAAGCCLGAILIPLATMDLRHRILPDPLTAALFASGVLAAALLPPPGMAAAAVGAAAGSGIFLALRSAWLRWRRIEALGLGDVKLMAGLGAWFGPAWLPLLVLVAAGAGLSAAVFHARKEGRGVAAPDAVPFGTCLAAAALLVWSLEVAAGVRGAR